MHQGRSDANRAGVYGRGSEARPLTLLPPKSAEKRPPVLPFRCPTPLRQRIDARVKSTNWSASKIVETVVDFGLSMWDALEDLWDRIDIVAKENGESFPKACRRLIVTGLGVYEKQRGGGKR